MSIFYDLSIMNLVNKEQLIGKFGYVMTVAQTLLKASFTIDEVSTPYFCMEALCLKDPLHKLIIGNISGVRARNDPDEIWWVKRGAITDHSLD